MGLTLRCKKTRTSIDMSAGGFFRLRNKVAEFCPEPFRSHYMTLKNLHTQTEFEAFDAKTEEILAAKQINIKIADFLLQSDVEGRIRYGACKAIQSLIGDYDDNLIYGYAGRPDAARFKDFKRILRECVETKSDLIWD